jgi:DNA-binding NarL/FixJ family response regulator
MRSICCLAGIDRSAAPIFARILAANGFAAPVHARLDVRVLGLLGPSVLICDLDGLAIDALEFLRQVRFVLPDCTIAVSTGVTERAWGVACHLAGANALLAKDAGEAATAAGIRAVLASGCFTDPRFSPEFHDTGPASAAV